MTDHEYQTQDLRRRASPTTAAPTEQQAQKVGRWSFRAGIALSFASPLLALSAAVLSDSNLFQTGPGRVFGTLALIALMLAGASLIIVGRIETLMRPVRDRQVSNAEAADAANNRLRILVEQLTLDHEERYRNIEGLVAPLPGLVSAVEERVASLEAGQHALVTALPEEVQRQYWLGFNDAVREGYQESNGTDGTAKRRPTRLGLVGRDGDNGQT